MNPLPYLSAADLESVLDIPSLVDALRDAFARDVAAPPRPHYDLGEAPDSGTLLLMPAWETGRRLGVKLVTVFPDNPSHGLPAVQGLYVLLDGATGTPRALLDGAMLTRRRTAAASALAATYLARPDSRRLLMVGAGALAPHLVEAHAAVRPISEIEVWNRTPEKAESLALSLRERGREAHATTDLERAVRRADVVSCATFSREPLVRGAWLKEGAHLDLVGSFTPEMREADEEAVRRSSVYVDSRAHALHEAGELASLLSAGRLKESDVAGDLHELARGAVSGRETKSQRTLFKSVGHALEDLAAATLAWERGLGASPAG